VFAADELGSWTKAWSAVRVEESEGIVMTRYVNMLFWVTFLAALMTATPVFAFAEFQGSVVSAAEHRLVLAEESTRHVFAVTKHTTITVDGEQATFDDVMPGFTARVMAEQQGDSWDAPWIATSIDAYSSK
jgi:hypothetical protein